MEMLEDYARAPNTTDDPVGFFVSIDIPRTEGLGIVYNIAYHRYLYYLW